MDGTTHIVCCVGFPQGCYRKQTSLFQWSAILGLVSRKLFAGKRLSPPQRLKGVFSGGVDPLGNVSPRVKQDSTLPHIFEVLGVVCAADTISQDTRDEPLNLE